MTNDLPQPQDENLPEILSPEEQAALEKITGGEWGKYDRVAMAALSGIPWIGSLIGAAGTWSAEADATATSKVIYLWVKEHERKLRELAAALKDVFARFETFGKRIETRIQSEEYLSIVRKTFSTWDQVETIEKKDMLRKLIANAGGTEIVQDDWIRIFIEWIDQYNELHFRVIAEVYKQKRITRWQIWKNIKGEIPTDSSAEADMFKILMDDLTLGRVIRQERQINSAGQFLKERNTGPRGSTSSVMKSPFDNEEHYVLTELGNEFVRYVLTELTPQIESA